MLEGMILGINVSVRWRGALEHTGYIGSRARKWFINMRLYTRKSSVSRDLGADERTHMLRLSSRASGWLECIGLTGGGFVDEPWPWSFVPYVVGNGCGGCEPPASTRCISAAMKSMSCSMEASACMSDEGNWPN
jgi:hypothetical protein